MPLYAVNIQKTMGTWKWGNTYHVEASDLLAASMLGQEIANIEANIYHQDVRVTGVGVRTAAQEDKQFNVTLVSIPGKLTMSTQLLPLFCVVRVDFSVFGQRPSRKFLRGTLSEGGVDSLGVITTTHRTAINNGYCTPISQKTYLRDEDGQPFGGVQLFPNVTKRNLTRRQRRAAA